MLKARQYAKGVPKRKESVRICENVCPLQNPYQSGKKCSDMQGMCQDAGILHRYAKDVPVSKNRAKIGQGDFLDGFSLCTPAKWVSLVVFFWVYRYI